MDHCPACGKPFKSASSKFCSHCGASRLSVRDPFSGHINRCTNTQCKNYDAELGSDELYCELCGHITAFGKIVKSQT